MLPRRLSCWVKVSQGGFGLCSCIVRTRTLVASPCCFAYFRLLSTHFSERHVIGRRKYYILIFVDCDCQSMWSLYDSGTKKSRCPSGFFVNARLPPRHRHFLTLPSPQPPPSRSSSWRPCYYRCRPVPPVGISRLRANRMTSAR